MDKFLFYGTICGNKFRNILIVIFLWDNLWKSRNYGARTRISRITDNGYRFCNMEITQFELKMGAKP
jgi:hypothetical protein